MLNPNPSGPPEVRLRVGPYTLVSKIGQGGAGSVWLAERADGEIEQTVAVKLLTAAGSSHGWLEHFLREQRILASLQHASIVRMMDAGSSGDAGPYLVMEYVQGVPINAHCACIAIRDRLSLFLQVCDAVAHAHRRLVIHRDLKPSNILVDRAGQVKILDFGIARLLDDHGDSTQTSDRALTPRYASPEQLQGAPQTTTTDVYSLGLILYEILAGESPWPCAASRDGEPPPIRRAEKFSPDVDYILRKALRVEPEERYRSVDALAADIRALLESRPVAARSGEGWYRTRKFLRRRRGSIAMVAAAAAGLAIALALAIHGRMLAQSRFEEVRQLAHAFVFEIPDEAARVAGTTKARQVMARAGLDYLDRLARDAASDLGLQREIAAAYTKIGDAEGMPTFPNLGRIEDAVVSYRKAADLYQRITSRNPVYRSDLGRFYVQYATLMRFINLKRARELAASAIAAFDPIRAGGRGDAKVEQNYIAAWCTIGDMDEDLGDFRQAWSDYTRCRDLAKVRGNGIAERQALSNLAQADERVATAAQELGFLSEALRALDEDQAAMDQLLFAAPHDPKFRRRRALVDHYRSNLFYSNTGASFGDPLRALESARAYLKRAEDMAAADPNDSSARLSNAIALSQVAFCLKEFEAESAVRMARRSLRLFDQAIAAGERNYLISSRRVLAVLRLGESELRAGRGRDALRSAESALSEERRVGEKNGDAVEQRITLISALILAGRATAPYNASRAESLLREARERAAGMANPLELQRLIPLANAERALVDFYSRRGRTSEARSAADRLAALWRNFPGSNEYVERQKEMPPRPSASGAGCD